MAELFGKSTGVAGGRGGALHLADAAHGVMGVFGVLTANVPMATGSALAAQITESGAVTVCFFGDRATNEGVFHESMNVASLLQLPVLYVGINNAPEDADGSVGEHTAAGPWRRCTAFQRMSSMEPTCSTSTLARWLWLRSYAEAADPTFSNATAFHWTSRAGHRSRSGRTRCGVLAGTPAC
jgi:hypothetical protein